MTPDRHDVVIAGGGFVGLALAIALSRTTKGELRVVVVDPGAVDPLSPSPPDARASALGAASRHLLEQTGVWADVAARAQAVSTIEITDSSLTDGVRPVLLTYDTAMDDDAAGMHIVANGHLLTALQRAVRRSAGVIICPQTRVLSSEVRSDGVSVVLSNGQTLHAALVVAADGRKSPLREAAGIKSVSWPHDQMGIVTTIAHETPHEGRAVQHFLPGGPFAILPLPGNRACVTWTEARTEAERLMAADDTTFAAAVDQRAGGKLGRITVDGQRQSWPLETALARALIADRLALIGDAARSVHPLAGQGLNLGFRDVAALAEVIVDAAMVGQDIGSIAILERYERWRRADGAMSAGSFDALNRLFSNDSQLLRTARSAGLGIVDRSPALKRLLVGEAAGVTGVVPRLMRGA